MLSAWRSVKSPARYVIPALKAELELTELAGGYDSVARLGAVSPFTCPSCRGALWEIDEGGHLRYRCHTGHAFSQESLLLEQDEAAEQGLYVALRAVEEKAAALRRLGAQLRSRTSTAGDGYEERALELDAAARAMKS